jgi:hypothetical protein
MVGANAGDGRCADGRADVPGRPAGPASSPLVSPVDGRSAITVPKADHHGLRRPPRPIRAAAAGHRRDGRSAITADAAESKAQPPVMPRIFAFGAGGGRAADRATPSMMSKVQRTAAAALV